LKGALKDIDGQQESDIYGNGKIIENFQDKFLQVVKPLQIDVQKKKLESILVAIYEETDVGLTSNIKETSDKACFYEVSIGDGYANIPKEGLRNVFQMLDERLRETK
jgi:hypothetical protein